MNKIKCCPNTGKQCIRDECLSFRLITTLKSNAYKYLGKYGEHELLFRLKEYNKPYCSLFKELLDE
ncbi:hypothetical protein M0R19_05935 [Candidatus Pacearchaeota archaeon]|jgi:hypothetical protein|nr:hypothetical protein [Candidatus Pacearchaeota archaeon]